jgi:hypothetical protein
MGGDGELQVQADAEALLNDLQTEIELEAMIGPVIPEGIPGEVSSIKRIPSS